MSILTAVAAKSSNDYQSASSYKSATFSAVGSGNSLVLIIRVLAAELPFVVEPQAYNGTTDVPMVLVATDTTISGQTTFCYKLDNVTHAPTSIRYKVNASSGDTQQASDVFEIGNTSGYALTLRVDQKFTPATLQPLAVNYTALTNNEFAIAYLNIESGGPMTPTAPWSLTIHGNYGVDSMYWADSGSAGAKTVQASSLSDSGGLTAWVLTFSTASPGPTVSTITGTTATEGSAVVFTVTMSGTGGLTDAYSWSGTAGSGDYTQTLTDGMFTTTGGSGSVIVSGGNIVVPSAVTEFTVTVPTTGDTLDEANETIRLVFGGVTASSGTITDDDVQPTVTISDATEVAGTVTFVATLSAASGKTITFVADTADGTKTAGVDYTALTGSTVTFNPGETTKNIVVTAL